MKTTLMTLTFARSRIGRGSYWLIMSAVQFVNFVLTLFIAAYAPSPLVLCIVVWWIILAYPWLVVCAARYRDMGRPGTCAFMTLVPVIGIFALIRLGIVKGVPDAD